MLPNMAMPGRPPVAPQPQFGQQPSPQYSQQQPTQWQTPAQPIYQASQPLPAKIRGVMADPAPAKFVLPSPEALGVAVNLNASQPAPNAPVDWNRIQARMERLSVVGYQKDRLPGGVQVTIILPTSDPARGQPVQARAETEAAAVLMALDAAEAWAQKR